MLKPNPEIDSPDPSPDHDSPSESFLKLDSDHFGLSGQIAPDIRQDLGLEFAQIERRSSYMTMTRVERETYDTARAYQGNELLFVPRMSRLASQKSEHRVSNGYIRPDATVILVDGTDVAEIPYREFSKIHPQLFAEVLRYAHTRHLLDKPGRLIEMAEYLIQNSELP